MSGFTAGPWRIGSDHDYLDIDYAERESTHCIVAANGDHVVCSGHDYDEHGIIPDVADKRLIAAAPELYEAAKAVLERLDQADHANEALIWNRERALLALALTKAEGR